MKLIVGQVHALLNLLVVLVPHILALGVHQRLHRHPQAVAVRALHGVLHLIGGGGVVRSASDLALIVPDQIGAGGLSVSIILIRRSDDIRVANGNPKRFLQHSIRTHRIGDDIPILIPQRLPGNIGVLNVAGGAVLADIPVAGGQVRLVVGVPLRSDVRHGDLGPVDALDELDGRGAGVRDGDVDPLHRVKLVDLLHVVAHVDLHVGGQLVDAQVAGVPQLQGLVAVDAGVPYLHAQVPDLGEQGVDGAHVLLQLVQLVVPQGVHGLGVVVEQPDQRLGRAADGGVVLHRAHLAVEGFQLGEQVVELGLDNAEFVGALTHLVQDVGQLLQTVQLGVGGTHVGVLIAVADVQEGVPQLGHAFGQHTVANIQVVAVGVADVSVGVEGHQVQPLAGVALGVDVGDVVARHIQRRLGGVNPQPRSGEGTKSTNNSHSCSPLYCPDLKPGNRSDVPCVFPLPHRRRRPGRP